MNVLAVAYDRRADEILERCREQVGAHPANMGIVDVGGAMRSAAEGATAGETGGQNVVRSVTDPADLPAIERMVDDYLTAWPTDDRRTVVYIDSLTTLLSHASLWSAVQFLDGLTTRVADAGADGYFHLSAVDERTVDALSPVFDVVVDADDGRDTRRPDECDDASSELGVDEVFEVLSARRRRFALHHLCRERRPVAVRTLAERITEWERSVGSGATVTLERVYTGLYHSHLPKLENMGVVSIDDERELVELADNIRRVEPHLALAARRDPGG